MSDGTSFVIFLVPTSLQINLEKFDIVKIQNLDVEIKNVQDKICILFKKFVGKLHESDSVIGDPRDYHKNKLNQSFDR